MMGKDELPLLLQEGSLLYPFASMPSTVVRVAQVEGLTRCRDLGELIVDRWQEQS